LSNVLCCGEEGFRGHVGEGVRGRKMGLKLLFENGLRELTFVVDDYG
jgi:hypothetical protein